MSSLGGIAPRSVVIRASSVGRIDYPLASVHFNFGKTNNEKRVAIG